MKNERNGRRIKKMILVDLGLERFGSHSKEVCTVQECLSVRRSLQDIFFRNFKQQLYVCIFTFETDNGNETGNDRQ